MRQTPCLRFGTTTRHGHSVVTRVHKARSWCACTRLPGYNWTVLHPIHPFFWHPTCISILISRCPQARHRQVCNRRVPIWGQIPWTNRSRRRESSRIYKVDPQLQETDLWKLVGHGRMPPVATGSNGRTDGSQAESSVNCICTCELRLGVVRWFKGLNQSLTMCKVVLQLNSFLLYRYASKSINLNVNKLALMSPICHG